MKACLQKKKTQRICITHLDCDKAILRILIHPHIHTHDRMRESSRIQQMSTWGVKQPPQWTLLLQSSTLMFLSPTEVRKFLNLVFWVSIYSCWQALVPIQPPVPWIRVSPPLHGLSGWGMTPQFCCSEWAELYIYFYLCAFKECYNVNFSHI